MIPTVKRHIIPDMPTAEEILPYLKEIDANLWYSNFGPLVTRFEKEFAATMAKAHNAVTPHCATTVSTGYHALIIALRLMGIKSGDKVLIPAVTFPACPLAVQNLGAEPILCDVDPDSWILTPAIAKAAAANMKIDAVMPVCLYGMALPTEEWDAFIEETQIPVLIDAAAAIETQRYLKRGFVAHSLHATKPFGAGEGGMIVSADEDMAAKIRCLTNFGTINRITQTGGENAKMSEYHAAVALAQLARWERVKARRTELVRLYTQELAPGAPHARIHHRLQESVVCNLMVQVDNINLPEIYNTLEKSGVACHRTYLPPLYTHPYFASLPRLTSRGILASSQDEMTGSQRLDKTLIGLPFYPQMRNEDVQAICRIFIETLQA